MLCDARLLLKKSFSRQEVDHLRVVGEVDALCCFAEAVRREVLLVIEVSL